MTVSNFAFPSDLSASFVLTLCIVLFMADLLARAGFPIASVEGRYSCVDGLRGLCALGVVFHHFSIWLLVKAGLPWQEPPVHALNQLGAGAVGMFFMITGLVFYPKVLQGFSQVDWTTLYVRRAFRIVPLVTFSTICVSIIVIEGGGRDFSAHQLINLFQWVTTYLEPDLFGFKGTHIVNAHVLWSLRYEWLFYIFLLPLMAWVRQQSKATKTWKLPITLLMIGLALSFMNYRFSFLALFATGMIAHEVRSRENLRLWFCSNHAAVIAAAGMVLAFWLTKSPYRISLPIFGFFLISVSCGNSFWGVLNSRALRVLGEISFSVYVLHGVILYLAFETVSDRVSSEGMFSLFILPVAVAVVLAAAFTYILVERPTNVMGGRVANFLVGYRQRRLTKMQVEVAP